MEKPFVMKQNQFFNDFSSLNFKSIRSTAEIVGELIAGHAIFRDKLIPEIEQHFLVLLSQADDYSMPSLAKCFKQFDVFRTSLMEHIEMEEKIVFPYLLGNGTYKSKETVDFFIEHHEDYETQLQHMIASMSFELAHLSPLMSFRFLVHKMNTFSEKLEEHSETEDSLLFVLK